MMGELWGFGRELAGPGTLLDKRGLLFEGVSPVVYRGYGSTVGNVKARAKN